MKKRLFPCVLAVLLAALLTLVPMWLRTAPLFA